ncbi:isochorismate synthase [Jeotgalibacillus sp. ET6]|uniref:isochorismate synthase n=1 Tax=Jeotgalibacillus sp. ET6 TaxID=3037260 RepID=UPI002418A90A|nr:isochorismate synthase [Jeotgalibacillus sp. ET6]MDG5473572.1 isochorismate synthase [Jeotgalibacillus sp. ET6]
MRILQQSHGLAAFEEAIRLAHQSKREVLFSQVARIDNVAPLQFYEAGYELYQGERSFWQDRTGELTLVGAGNAQTFTSNKKNERFIDIKQQWKEFLSEAVCTGENETGTGPVAVGGFSFDPRQEAELEWTNFSNGYFHLPSFMLTINAQGDCFLTSNIVCSEFDDSKKLWERMQKERDQLLNETKDSMKDVSVISMTEIEPERWKTSLTSVVRRLKKGEMEKVVLARKILVDFDGKKRSDTVLERLRDDQASSFIFSLEVLDSCFIGATPERLVKKSKDDILSTCLAGSIARGGTIEEDRHLSELLLQDEKNLHEHELVVRMITDNLKDLCTDVKVPSSPALMKIRDIQHLYTPVKGVAQEGMSVVDFVDRLHPTPALGGTPTHLAMDVIQEEEKMNRGFYAAPVGWMDAEGNGEFAVAIRSGLLHDRHAYLYAGCGVVKDSNAESEYEETLIKFRPMLRAVGGTMQ